MSDTMVQMVNVAVEAHKLISKIVNAVAPAEAIVGAVQLIEHQIEQGFAGHLTPQTVLSRIESFAETLHSNDVTALSLLAKKFGRPS